MLISLVRKSWPLSGYRRIHDVCDVFTLLQIIIASMRKDSDAERIVGTIGGIFIYFIVAGLLSLYFVVSKRVVRNLGGLISVHSSMKIALSLKIFIGNERVYLLAARFRSLASR